uniref:Secreted protein n=1 Tax=Xiphophorus couchianus TaxID=32473 RepID=A0A3B5LE28_9TELE
MRWSPFAMMRLNLSAAVWKCISGTSDDDQTNLTCKYLLKSSFEFFPVQLLHCYNGSHKGPNCTNIDILIFAMSEIAYSNTYRLCVRA